MIGQSTFECNTNVREYVELDKMVGKWIGTKEMLADGFTKVLPGPALANLRDKLLL